MTAVDTRVPELAPPRRLLDGAVFALLPMAAIQVQGYPLSELATGGAVLLAAFRRSTTPRVPTWFPALLAALWTWLLLASLLADVPAYRRLIHLALFAGLAFFLAEGRFAMVSAARGMVVGLAVAAGVGVAGINVEAIGVLSGYEGRLTGLLGDPNAAGFYLVVLGTVCVGLMPDRRLRMVLIPVLLFLIALTLSRTSILAAALVAGWVVLGHRVRPLLGVAGVLVALLATSRVTEQLRLVGPFAERAGSDALRRRIVELEHLRINAAPWYGDGPGTSRVDVGGSEFFFHNSYLALLNEGGWLSVAIVMLLGLATLLSLARLRREDRNPWLEAALVAVATCALNLGEVLLELPAAVALGVAAHHIARHRARRAGEPARAVSVQ